MRGIMIVVALTLFTAMAAAQGATPPATIDGRWCFPDGRSLTIDGYRITTPGGARLIGEYGRHDFRYVVPPGEPGDGMQVNMILMNENLVSMTYGARAGTAEVLRRCGGPPG